MSWIYFIREGESGQIKIGRAGHPCRRLTNLQVGNPRTLYLLAAFRGGKDAKDLEEGLHARFSKQRISGEWFSPTSELLELVQQTGLPSCTECLGQHAALFFSLNFDGTSDAYCWRCAPAGSSAS